MTIWYCPYCHATVMRERALEDECDCGVSGLISWPASVPLPTEANVRGLVAERDALRDLVKANDGVARATELVREMKGECGG